MTLWIHLTGRQRLLNLPGGCSLLRDYTFKDLLICKGEVTLHLLPQLLYTFGQMTWLPFSRQIRLLCPILKGMSVCYGLLSLYFSYIPASKNSVGRQLESASTEAWWGRGVWQWYLISFVLLALLGWLNEAHTCHANVLQLGTSSNANSSLHQSGVSAVSAFQFTHSLSSPMGGSRGGPSSSELSTSPVRKEVTPGSNSGSSPRSESLGVGSPLSDSGLSQTS